MKQAELDNRRHEMMEALYARSGRTCNTYTGLWDEFAHDLANNTRDVEYQDLFNAVCLAMSDTQSVLVEKHAQQAIQVVRRYILGKWA
jgi:hypothetical protein